MLLLSDLPLFLGYGKESLVSVIRMVCEAVVELSTRQPKLPLESKQAAYKHSWSGAKFSATFTFEVTN